MPPNSSLPPARTIAQRKRDTLAKLESQVDAWVASASAGGEAHLVPLSFWWDGEKVTFATRRRSITARNLARAERARIALGPTRDVVIIEGPVDVTPLEDDERLADAYAAATGWDPRESTGRFVLMRVTPRHIQAWREVNENVQDRDIMEDGKWLA